MSLANIQGKLSRKELKEVMAGSGADAGGGCATRECSATSCFLIASCLNILGQPYGGNYFCSSYWTHGGEVQGGYCHKPWA